jgi:hypothetical protein
MEFISEQQKCVILNNDRYKLINGCAGSHKTDTLIKCAIHDLEINKRPILYLTLVNSVVNEIKKRLEKRLGICISQLGKSGHYLGYYNGIPVSIANYDAWVHLMLSDYPDLEHISSYYSRKIEILLNKVKTENVSCYIKVKCENIVEDFEITSDEVEIDADVENTFNDDTFEEMEVVPNGKIKAGLLIIDEAQDFDIDKMTVITYLALNQKDLSIYIAGDYLQTLFLKYDNNIENINEIHSMNIFKSIGPTYYDLNICMRCPKAHVDFNNLIMKDIQGKYGIPKMLSNNDDNINKPLLFPHYPISNNTNTLINAEIITKMIHTLMLYDETILPSDICIIMSKTNDNEIYKTLEYKLTQLYINLDKGENNAKHMHTMADGYHSALNWESISDQTVMLSIHGFKGKSSKVVFFLGVTEQSVPREVHIYKPIEIISESLLNVGITRSTKYLFIGFTYNFPSRYLLKYYKELNKYAYLSWEPFEDYPEPYNDLAEMANSYLNETKWEPNKYKKAKTMIGSKSVLNVKYDLSKDFEHINEFMGDTKWSKSYNQITFGTKLHLGGITTENHHILLGLLSELLMQRILNKYKLFKFLEEYTSNDNIIYTLDNNFVSCMYDINHMFSEYKENDLNNYFNDYKHYFNKNKQLKDNIRFALRGKKKVVSNIFGTDEFQNNLSEFLSDKNNEELSSSCLWNINLFYTQLKQRVYNPIISNSLNGFNEDISTLHQNIRSYIKRISGKYIKFEESYNLDGNKLDEGELAILNKRSHNIKIMGRCDIHVDDRILEIKSSKLEECSHQWIIQTLNYVLLSNLYDGGIRRVEIINILAGIIYEWELIDDFINIEEIIHTKISKKYNWHQLEERCILESIKNLISDTKRIEYIDNIINNELNFK